MNDTENEVRLKRLKYRANHRGIKEMDIILGRFANVCLDDMTAEELDDFETLMSEHDRDLLNWFTGESEFPLDDLVPMFERIKSYASDKASHG